MLVVVSHLPPGISVSVSTFPETTRVQTVSQTRKQQKIDCLTCSESRTAVYRLNESTRGHYKHNTLLLGNDSLPCSSPVRTSPCPAQRAALPFGMIIICTRIRVVSCMFLKISSPRLRRQFSRNCADFQDYKYSFTPLSMKRAHVVIVLPWVSTARSIACHRSFVLCHCHT